MTKLLYKIYRFLIPERKLQWCSVCCILVEPKWQYWKTMQLWTYNGEVDSAYAYFLVAIAPENTKESADTVTQALTKLFNK